MAKTSAKNLENIAELARSTTTGKLTSSHDNVDLNEGEDPEDEDGQSDDLDDLLDEFTAISNDKQGSSAKTGNLDNKPTIESSNIVGVPVSQLPKPSGVIPSDDEELAQFERELEKQMSAILNVMQIDAAKDNTIAEDLPQSKLNNKSDGLIPTSTDADRASSQKDKSAETSFQDTIRRTIERMQSSDKRVNVVTEDNIQSTEEESFLNFLKQMSEQAQKENGESNFLDESALPETLTGLMEELFTKESLYDPMKELLSQYPEWISKNQGSLDAFDVERYRDQLQCVRVIVSTYELPDYSNDNPAYKVIIHENMDKMLAAGTPPSDLIDMNLTSNLIDSVNSICPTQ